jgi:hypothetical protein
MRYWKPKYNTKLHAKKFAVFKTARPKICGFETANQNRTLKIKNLRLKTRTYFD